MRSSLVVLAALATLAGCRMEGDGTKAAADSAAQARRAGMPAGHTVFARRVDSLAPGLTRVTLSAIVRADAGLDSAQRKMEDLLAAARRTDSTAAAIRILAYLPPPQQHGGPGATSVSLIPLGYTDWAPEPGFDSLGVATRTRPYRTVTRFVHDSATLRAMGLVGPASPHGTLPPATPRPR